MTAMNPVVACCDGCVTMNPTTAELIRGSRGDLGRVNDLDRFVLALKTAGIWDNVGRITWARDACDGLVLLWEPANPVATA